jgi:hypothetical protein
MKLRDKLFKPYSRRYWALIRFLNIFIPTGFAVYREEQIREYSLMLTFLSTSFEIDEQYEEFRKEIQMSIVGSEVDEIFEDLI